MKQFSAAIILLFLFIVGCNVSDDHTESMHQLYEDSVNANNQLQQLQAVKNKQDSLNQLHQNSVNQENKKQQYEGYQRLLARKDVELQALQNRLQADEKSTAGKPTADRSERLKNDQIAIDNLRQEIENLKMSMSQLKTVIEEKH